MKKLTYLTMVAALVVALSGTVFGAVKKATVKVYSFKGEVSAVDTTANSLTVKGAKGDVAFAVDSNTKIMIGKQTADLASLKAGDKVVVTYKVAEGKKLALKITVRAASSSSAPKTK